MKKYTSLILVVEDDPNDQKLIELAFRANGVTLPIQIAGGSPEAIAYLKGTGPFADRRRFPYPTFILLDLKMPGNGGFEVLEYLRRNPESSVVPTVVLSESDEAADIKKSYRLGASSYHLKPAHFEDLKKQLGVLHDYWMTCEVPAVDITGKHLATESRGKLGENHSSPTPEGNGLSSDAAGETTSYHSLILIAEDEPADRMLIEHAFRRIGVADSIQMVAHGGEALAYLKGEGKYSDRQRFRYPTFIITDLKMPVANGFEVLAHLKRNPDSMIIPTVVLSASADPDDVNKSYLLGASAYHLKPNSLDQLMSQLKVLHEYWLTAKVPAVDHAGRQVSTEDDEIRAAA